MKIHLIAIGGSVMHNLAIALKKNGHIVSGSDDEIFEPSRSRLESYRLLPSAFGWFPDKIDNTIDVIILGMHARIDNPELLRAQELGLKIYSYPEYLYEHSKNKKRVVIGGSHGKTTITAMIMHVMKHCSMDFDYLVGSKIENFDVMVQLSDHASIMIFEGDEYLSSPIDRRPKFHWYHPHIALISGIAWDHINVFPTIENYNEQFSKFIQLIEKEGVLIYSTDNEVLHGLVQENKRDDLEIIPYQVSDYLIEEGVTYLKSNGRNIPLKVFGKHNMMNLGGARLVCKSMGISENDFDEAISGFEGTSNRLELIERNDRFILYKDFAHAPSKVKATINAVKEQYADYELIACLELHTFSSLNKDFLSQYEGSFKMADKGCTYYNPHTVEMKKLEYISPNDIKEAFGKKDLEVFTDSAQMAEWLRETGEGKKVILMMSSGNFNGIDFKKLFNLLSPSKF
ncbi:MAG: Mur ligase family protein [Bacteroidales bacterium]|jgi:UDP-N-acetylmuramate: L-alanyl-gamma-D-glutamyl-meso-diaminopimelate ligase|nr:Mur ligase family protein [Bacteroidales bacterium]